MNTNPENKHFWIFAYKILKKLIIHRNYSKHSLNCFTTTVQVQLSRRWTTVLSVDGKTIAAKFNIILQSRNIHSPKSWWNQSLYSLYTRMQALWCKQNSMRLRSVLLTCLLPVYRMFMVVSTRREPDFKNITFPVGKPTARVCHTYTYPTQTSVLLVSGPRFAVIGLL